MEANNEKIQIFIDGEYHFNWENYTNKPDGYVIIDDKIYRVLERNFKGDVFRIFLVQVKKVTRRVKK